MGAALFRVAYACLVAALAIIGGRLALGTVPDQPWQEALVPWLEQVGLPLALLIAASVLAAIPITKWVLDRCYARDLQRQIRQNLTPGSFAETDACEALHYLLMESVWGWRQYARLNFWSMVDGLHPNEMERAGLAGKILVTGFGSVEGKTVLIERRLWASLKIDPSTIKSPNSVVARVPRRHPIHPIEYSDLAIATADIAQVWPRASAMRRILSRLWVWLKTRWYGSRLSRWLDNRTRTRKT